MKYAYPAFFTEEEVAGRGTVTIVEFPDILGCATEADTTTDAIAMAREALAECILAMQARGEQLPKPSRISTLKCEAGFVSLVDLDMQDYIRRTNTRAVKRMVSLPQWLDEMARDSGLNFSQTVQDAIKERLGIQP